MSQPSSASTGNNKAYAAGIVGSGCTILVWLWGSFVPAHPIPPEIEGAIMTLFVSLSVYLTPHGGSQ